MSKQPESVSDTLADILGRIPKLSPDQIHQRELSDLAIERRDAWIEDSRELPQMPWARLNTQFWLNIPEALKRELLNWRPNRHGVIILGPTGVGKTAGLLARLHSLRVASSPANTIGLPRFLWTTEAKLKRAQRQHALGRGEAPLVRRAQHVRHLIIDEVGPATDVELMHAVILDERYAHGLPTTITTGLTMVELGERYGFAFVRRLAELATVVDLHE